jgi:hypothetical protein
MHAVFAMTLLFNSMLFLHALEIFLTGGNIFLGFHLHLFGLMVKDDEIAVHEIEAIEFVTGLFCVQDILVDDKSGSFGGVGGPSADLSNGTELAKEVEQSGRVDVVGEVLDEKDAVGLRSQFVTARHIES